MKVKNINNLLWVVFALLFITGCGTGGSIPTSLETVVTGPSAFAVDVLCDGVECGDQVSGYAIFSAKVYPAVDAGVLSMLLACTDPNTGADVDYPLTLLSSKEIDGGMQHDYTAATKVPQVVDCMITAQVTASADISAEKRGYLDSSTPFEKSFSTKCGTSTHFDNPNELTRGCWQMALIEMPSGGGQVRASINILPAESVPFYGLMSYEAVKDSGLVNIEIINGALKVTGTADLAAIQGLGLFIYKKFDAGGLDEATPSLIADVTDSGVQYVYDVMMGTPTTNEGWAGIVTDAKEIMDTCSINFVMKGRLSGGEGAEEGFTPLRAGVDMMGMKLSEARALEESACGVEFANMGARESDAIFSREESVPAGPASMTIEIKRGWSTKHDDANFTWEGKDATTEIPSQYFDPSVNGASAGLMYFTYNAAVPAVIVIGGTDVYSVSKGGSVIIVPGEPGMPAEAFEPFTMEINEVTFDRTASGADAD